MDLRWFQESFLDVFEAMTHLRMATENMPIPAVPFQDDNYTLRIGYSEECAGRPIGARGHDLIVGVDERSGCGVV